MTIPTFEQFTESRFGGKVEWSYENRPREALDAVNRLLGFASRQPDSRDISNLRIDKLDADAMLGWIEEYVDAAPGDDLSVEIFGTVQQTTTRAGTRYSIPLLVENDIGGRSEKVILHLTTKTGILVDDFEVERSR